MYVVLCQGENKNMLIQVSDDHYTTYIFASKGTHAAYLNLIPQYRQSV